MIEVNSESFSSHIFCAFVLLYCCQNCKIKEINDKNLYKNSVIAFEASLFFRIIYRAIRTIQDKSASLFFLLFKKSTQLWEICSMVTYKTITCTTIFCPSKFTWLNTWKKECNTDVLNSIPDEY